jgi:hypothetical protein
MPIVPALIATAATVGGAVIASSGAKKAARVQDEAAKRSEQTAKDTFDKQAALQEPFRQGGLTAQNKLMELLALGGDTTSADYGSAAKPFGMDQFKADPSYDFRMAESSKALERSAAARGSLLSGSTLKGIQRFSQDLASQEYQNAFNRYQIERSARLNPLQSLMGSGQSATNVMTGAAGTEGQNVANAQMNSGAARASGYVGSANALSGALGSIGNMAVNYPLNNAMMKYYSNNTPSGGSVGYGNGAMQGVNGFLAGSPYRASNYGVNGFGN